MNPNQQQPQPLTPSQQLQQLQNAIQKMRADLSQSQNLTQGVSDELQNANQNNTALQERLQAQSVSRVPRVKMKKPESFRGKGSIKSWVMHMDSYTRSPSSRSSISDHS